MMTCCKDKAVLVAVYQEKPRKRSLTTRSNNDIKHHHHHHHHHLHIHGLKNNKGNRKAELLSYSQHLRKSSNLKASTPPHHQKSLVTSTTNDQETKTKTQVQDVEKKQKLKKQSGSVDMKSIFKCFAMSNAKRKMKRKKKKSASSSSNKASTLIKRFNSRTQKGARRFFSKLNAFIQKHR
ncbi:hypothetical protein QVD17_13308 [Tagetes erecta]|uniref:Uncharacterized protein n=1 Tax=Tagetes erecta TaxID=13708 RepID=A0AAD8KXM8_TARER|nr:hypothetical protein QVD17_13308 [Tagetes erecta]